MPLCEHFGKMSNCSKVCIYNMIWCEERATKYLVQHDRSRCPSCRDLNIIGNVDMPGGSIVFVTYILAHISLPSIKMLLWSGFITDMCSIPWLRIAKLPVIHVYDITSISHVGYIYSSIPYHLSRFNKPQVKIGHGWLITFHMKYGCNYLTMFISHLIQVINGMSAMWISSSYIQHAIILIVNVSVIVI